MRIRTSRAFQSRCRRIFMCGATASCGSSSARQLVSCDDRTCRAGPSAWRGRTNCKQAGQAEEQSGARADKEPDRHPTQADQDVALEFTALCKAPRGAKYIRWRRQDARGQPTRFGEELPDADEHCRQQPWQQVTPPVRAVRSRCGVRCGRAVDRSERRIGNDGRDDGGTGRQGSRRSPGRSCVRRRKYSAHEKEESA